MPSFSPGTPKRSFRIPTILGLLVLVIALGVGVLFFNQGFEGFAPRATPEATPKNVEISNLTDTGFNVSFLTDAATPGFIKYGTSPTALNTQAGDERDQLSGTVGEYLLHDISVRGLVPGTTYYFVLGTTGNDEFDDQGAPFTVQTGPTLTSSAASRTIYGNVLNASGEPAEGAMVFVESSDSGQLSALVKSSGSWAIPLSIARTADGSALANINDDTLLTITAQGVTPGLSVETQATVANAQPVTTLSLGGSLTAASPVASPIVEDTTFEAINPASLSTTTSGTASGSGGLTSNAPVTQEVLDLTSTAVQTVTTQPVVVGEAVPNVPVNIEIHSDANISQQVTAGSDGVFALDVATLSQSLDPGQHTVTYSYVDPTSGQTVTKNQTFTVAAANGAVAGSTSTGTLLAQAPPFGSGNPVPVPSPSPTPTLRPSPTPTLIPASGSATSTRSATRSAQTSQPSTGSGLPVSGSTGTTLALIGGGIFFILAGAWSFWVAQHLNSRNEIKV